MSQNHCCSPPAKRTSSSQQGLSAGSTRRGIWWLVGILSCVGAVWLGLLPKLAETDAVRRRAERNERLGIDPTAMFYSEHDGLERWVGDVKRAQRGTGLTTRSVQ